MTRIIAVLCAVLLSQYIVRADKSLYATSSVLSKGHWVKIRVNDDGIYKLTYSDLKSMGFSDPSKVSVHGYGGWMLDEDFSKPYIDDLPAVSVYRGKDYILFYGRGPVKWSYVSRGSRFVHENNPYSMHGYYFVTDATETNEMGMTPSQGSPARKVTTFDEHLLHEIDREFLQKSGQTGSGRELFGESFTGVLSQDFPFSMPGITDDEGKVTVRFVSYTGLTGAGIVTVGIDGKQLLRGTIGQDNRTYTKASDFFGTGVWNGPKTEKPKVRVAYNKVSNTSFLDYIRLQAKRILQPYGAYTFFRDTTSIKTASQFIIRNATVDMVVFDVTDGVKVTQMETTFNGSELSFSIGADGMLREFVLVDPSKTFPKPETVGDVATQDLHALPQTDMVILAPPAFVGEAERLAEKHRTKRDKLSVVVVTPEQIYNEFSSGTPDATAIRRFMKMFYDRRTSDADAPKYLLLFGDGSHDNRQLSTAWKSIDMTNFLLTYQTRFSLGGAYGNANMETYVTDDYFGFLTDGEGQNIAICNLDLGIGRFPVRTLSEAKTVVDKVIRYIDTPAYGSWKNQLCFIADDGNNSPYDQYTTNHMRQSYQLTQILEADHPEYITNKLFFDAFKKSSSGSSGSYPDVETTIQKLQREGVMLINYTGHGNAESLSDEHVVKQSMIRQYTYPHLPLWITASCDFTPFDNTTTSAGEDVFLSNKSGGIALITTSRVAYDHPNFKINSLLIKYLFNKKNGRRMTLGEILKEAKNSYPIRGEMYYTRCFVLIGDPALTLAYPEYEVNVTEINGKPVSQTPVNFKALDRVTVTGEVIGMDSTVMTNFNGQMTAVILDSQKEITTLDNNKTGRKFNYKDYPNTIYKGNTIVENGRFTFSFIVPADISYTNGLGKMNLYAYDEMNALEANGSFKNYTVGGTADNIEKDSDGPEIRILYLNDSTWTDGGDANETPFFAAKLWDKSGINITGSSIGHDIMLTIDNNPMLSYNLNSYYANMTGSNGEGIVKFSIPLLPEGEHTAEFKVWDIFNNSTTKTFTFNVVKGLKPFISELTAGPVPARDKVTFYLYHNRPESRMDVTVYVYDMTGRLQWKHQESGSSDLFKAYTVSWDLINGSGARLSPGIYLYRAVIKTKQSAEATQAKKLIILTK